MFNVKIQVTANESHTNVQTMCVLRHRNGGVGRASCLLVKEEKTCCKEDQEQLGRAMRLHVGLMRGVRMWVFVRERLRKCWRFRKEENHRTGILISLQSEGHGDAVLKFTCTDV